MQQQQKRHPQLEINADFPPLLSRQIDDITEGIPKVFKRNLCMLSADNIRTVVSYLKAVNTEISLSKNYRKGIIELLTRFARFHAKEIGNKEFKFKDITREDIIKFLDSLRKLDEKDPMHKWIGTYNIYLIHITRFFKWFYSPDVEHIKRQKPAVVSNISKLKRKEKSIYKPTDMWTPQDDLLFLKFCPNLRDRCYHAVSRDLSARPHEILKLKVKEVVPKNVNGYVYYETTVNGKTGDRTIPLINSVPYLKDYLSHGHPFPNNPTAPFICGTGKSLGKHISSLAILKVYEKYKEKLFPKLLESPNVLPEDKQKIEQLLKKRWNPYVRRHSALTEKSAILKEHILRQHAGWSTGSQMPQKYLHYLGNESSNSILEQYGIIDKGIQIDPLRSKQCPNCSESNKPDSKFCSHCRMVLSYDSYNEVVQEQEQQKNDMELIKQKMGEYDAILKKFVT